MQLCKRPFSWNSCPQTAPPAQATAFGVELSGPRSRRSFLVAFTFASVLTVLCPARGRIPTDPWDAFVYLIANLMLAAGLVPILRIINVAWSLSCEMFFYFAPADLVLGLGMAKLSGHLRRAVKPPRWG